MNRIIQMVKGMDSFSQTQFFRYNKAQKFQTLTGGVVSVILLGIFLYAFVVLVIAMLEESALDNSTSLTHQNIPSLYNLKASPSSMFMFAFGINQLDLTSSKRYFDIVLENVQIQGNQPQTKTQIPMKLCTASQWSGINSEISDTYNNLNLNHWLCPPTDLVIPLQGKYSSVFFKYSRLIVRQCTNNINYPNTTCATKTEVDKLISDSKGLTISFYFINPLLNLGKKDYLGYYLEDSNYLMFDSSRGATANLYFSEYSVTTDNSYLPWSEKHTENGIIVNQQALVQTFETVNNIEYAKIYLRKGNVKYQTTRIYKKLQQIFSFLGGLFGLVLIIFFLFANYGKCAFEIEFGDNLFNSQKGSSYGSEHFNFIVYLGYYIYTTLKKYGIALNWHAMKKYEQCQQECVEQLDISLLFKKIELFEHMSHVVFGDYHLCGLHMIPKPTIKQIKHNRMRYNLKSQIYKQLDDKAREIHIQSEDYDRQLNKNLVRLRGSMRQARYISDKVDKDEKLKIQTSDHYLKLEEASQRGQMFSKKILYKIQKTQSLKKILKHLSNQSPEQKIPIVIEEQNHAINSVEELLNPMNSEQILINKTINDGQ